METNDLLKTLSTLTDESLKWKGDTKTCLFCGLSHWGHCFRSIRSEVPGWDHLSGTGKRFETVTLKGAEVQTISRAGPEHIDHHAPWHWQVVKELKERTNMTTYKPERWSRDDWRVVTLTTSESSTWKSLAKGLARLIK